MHTDRQERELFPPFFRFALAHPHGHSRTVRCSAHEDRVLALPSVVISSSIKSQFGVISGPVQDRQFQHARCCRTTRKRRAAVQTGPAVEVGKQLPQPTLLREVHLAVRAAWPSSGCQCAPLHANCRRTAVACNAPAIACLVRAPRRVPLTAHSVSVGGSVGAWV
jgi:hypothetical protein